MTGFDLPPIWTPPGPAIIRPAEQALLKPGAFRPCTRAEGRAILADLVRAGRMTLQDARAAVIFIPWIGASFSPYSTEYPTAGTQTIPVPSGATTVEIEVIAAGGNANHDGFYAQGGGGAGYAKRNAMSLAGITDIYISVPAQASEGACFARANTSGGTLLCNATGGSHAATSGGPGGTGTVGDVLHTGGNGQRVWYSGAYGGGAAGPTGNGGTPTSGGAPAGAGGGGGQNGSNYGGGGGDTQPGGAAGVGAQGWLKLSWA